MEAPESQPIFISYARQDADAARRIAEALRSSGLEVWFDQNELRGGDAWDQKIRRQIRECRLFIPVISANTESRGEGYFRLEWKLAVERTHLMAEGMPFIAPVSTDATNEGNAAVPAEFVRVQWSRLPGALPTPEFVAQIQRLLRHSRSPTPPGASSPPPSPPTPVRGKFRTKAGLVFAAAGLVALGVGFFLLRHRLSGPGRTSPQSSAAAAGPQVSDKSIAVLPLANLSAEKDSQFFTDGMHDELITDLAAIADLKVISRTSVLQYRDAHSNLRAIGRELGVTYIVEGSVRHVGDRVHVNAQLIDTRTDSHVWAGTFDKTTPDVFVLQASLAREIAGALQARLTPSETRRIERPRGASVEIYETVQRAREIIFHTQATQRDYSLAYDWAKEAVAREPNFPLGWATLGHVQVAMIYRGFDRSKERSEQAKAALDQALKLDPDLPETHWALGRFYQTSDYQLEAGESAALARTELERARSGMPNEPRILSDIASVIYYRDGAFAAATALERRAVELNPNDPLARYNLGRMLFYGGQTDDALKELQAACRLNPAFTNAVCLCADCLVAKNDLPGAQRAVDALPANLQDHRAVYYRFLMAYYRRDARTALQILASSPVAYFHDNDYNGPKEYLEGLAWQIAGDPAASRAKFALADQILAQHAKSNPSAQGTTPAMNAAYLGDSARALELLRTFENGVFRTPTRQREIELARALVDAVLGKSEEAVKALAYLIDTHWVTVGYLRTDPRWDKIRSAPGFQVLVR